MGFTASPCRGTRDRILEASTGFEPVIRVLQTLALPLGHDAVLNKTERAMGFEPTTFSLARRRSTTELHPQVLAALAGRECRESESN
jgi:hypothetical protein